MRVNFYDFSTHERIGSVWYDDDVVMQSDPPGLFSNHWRDWPVVLFYARYAWHANGYWYSIRELEPDDDSVTTQTLARQEAILAQSRRNLTHSRG